MDVLRDIVRETMSRYGVKQGQLAVEIGVSESVVSVWLSGHAPPVIRPREGVMLMEERLREWVRWRSNDRRDALQIPDSSLKRKRIVLDSSVDALGGTAADAEKRRTTANSDVRSHASRPPAPPASPHSSIFTSTPHSAPQVAPSTAATATSGPASQQAPTMPPNISTRQLLRLLNPFYHPDMGVSASTSEGSRPSTIDDFVPIVLSIPAASGFQGFHDAFVWNVNSPPLSLDHFIGRMCIDVGLPLSRQAEIVEAAKQQIQQHHLSITQVCNKLSVPNTSSLPSHVATMRLHLVKGELEYRDVLEWDITASYDRMQLFVDTTCDELGLPPGWQSAMMVAMLRQRRELMIREASSSVSAKSFAREPTARLRSVEEADAANIGPSIRNISAAK